MTEQPIKIIQTVKAKTEIKKYFLISFIPSLVYAVLRYNIFQEVSWSHMPMWVANKAFAMTATIMIGMSFSMRSDKPRKEIGLLGCFLALIHVFMSFSLLSPAYYEKFFQNDGRYNLTGELTMLTGVISLALLIYATFKSFPALQEKKEVNLSLIHKLVLLALILNLSHLVIMGASGWVTPEKWAGFMPPVSLVSATFCFFYISKRLLRKSS